MSAGEGDEETVRIRHEGYSTVSGGPAGLSGTDPGEEVVVSVEEAAHYIEYHGFVETDETDEPEPEAPDLESMEHDQLRALAADVDDVNGNQSTDALRDELAEHYGVAERSSAARQTQSGDVAESDADVDAEDESEGEDEADEE